MAICSYLVIPEAGAATAVLERIAALPGCDVVPALEHDILLLVTETADVESDEALRGRIEALEGVQALMLTFAEVGRA
jgi:nitrate reductase NapAB chaperone NapD